MRVPQVSERIKEAPAQALRGVFAGIGQLLLITDKLRNKAPGSQQAPQDRAPEPPEASAGTSRDEAPARAEAPVSDVKLLPQTRQVPQAQQASEAAKSPQAPRAGKAPPRAGKAPPRAGKGPETRDLDSSRNVRLLDSAAGAAGAAVKAPSAPLPNYDELSVASLRARLRYLDVAQLRQLADYEKGHAGRAEVITMFERRVSKLEAEASGAAEARAEAEVEAQEEVETEARSEVEAEAEAET
jgi:hypothetical protein